MNSPVITNDTLENLIQMMNLTNISNIEKMQLLNELRDTLIFVENLEQLHTKNTSIVSKDIENIWFEDGSENDRSIDMTNSFHISGNNLFEVEKVI